MDQLVLQADFLRKAEPLVDKYNERLEIVEQEIKDKKSRIPFTDFDKASLSIMLDNFDRELDRYKRMKQISDRTFSEQVGPFKKHAYNIITALYTTLEIRDLVSFQPLTQKRGAIYKMYYNFASSKGSVAANEAMFAPGQPVKRARYYSTQLIDGEAVTWTFSTPNSLATLAYFPLSRPDRISIVVTGGAAAGTYTYLSTSNGIYQLQKNAGGAVVGTVNPTTGIVQLNAVDATGDTGTAATYNWNSEKHSATSPIPRITIGVTEAEVTAERRQLLIDTMLDVSYDFESQFGSSLNAEMESTVIQFMQNEVAFRVLYEMFEGANGNGGATYNFDPDDCPAGIALGDYAQVLFKKLGEMSAKVRTNVGRGWGNKIITGDNMLNFLRILPQDVFVRAEKPIGDGPYFAGTLNGDYDIYYNPDYEVADFIMTYKGTSWWEAPYYVGTYLPLMNSSFLMYPDMHGEQGYLAMDAYSYEYPTMVVKGTIEH